jgi:hypothetical protein
MIIASKTCCSRNPKVEKEISIEIPNPNLREVPESEIRMWKSKNLGGEINILFK